MTDYTRLIKKYYKKSGANMTAEPKRNKAEIVSNDYDNQYHKEVSKRNRHLILDELVREVPFHVTKSQIKKIRFWIDRFNDDFKSFHRQASNETIILAFILIQRKQVNSKLDIDELAISKKYSLNKSIFITIQNRLIFKLMATTELTYTQSKYYNQDILIKEGR